MTAIIVMLALIGAVGAAAVVLGCVRIGSRPADKPLDEHVRRALTDPTYGGWPLR